MPERRGIHPEPFSNSAAEALDEDLVETQTDLPAVGRANDEGAVTEIAIAPVEVVKEIGIVDPEDLVEVSDDVSVVDPEDLEEVPDGEGEPWQRATTMPRADIGAMIAETLTKTAPWEQTENASTEGRSYAEWAAEEERLAAAQRQTLEQKPSRPKTKTTPTRFQELQQRAARLEQELATLGGVGTWFSPSKRRRRNDVRHALDLTQQNIRSLQKPAAKPSSPSRVQSARRRESSAENIRRVKEIGEQRRSFFGRLRAWFSPSSDRKAFSEQIGRSNRWMREQAPSVTELNEEDLGEESPNNRRAA